MKIKSLIATLIFLCSGQAFAAIGGDEKGNGGVVTSCEVDGKKVYEVVDFFEGREFHGLKLQFEQGVSYGEIVLKTISRLDRLNPSRANLYRTYFAEFAHEANFVGSTAFNPTPDFGAGVKPENCDLVQAVIQFKNPNISGFRYFVNKEIWQQLDEVNKAALVIHELIYREGIKAENAFESSVGVRYFNAVLHSDLIGKMTLRKYIEDVLGYRFFMDADANGFPIRLHTPVFQNSRPLLVEYWDENTVKKASIGSSLDLLAPHKRKIHLECNIKKGFEEKHQADFYTDGVLKSVKLKCERRFGVGLEYKNISGGVFIDNLYYTPHGDLERIETYASNGALPLVFAYRSPNFNFERAVSPQNDDLLVKFDEEGLPSFLCFGRSETIDTNWILTRGDRVSLDKLNNFGRNQNLGITFHKDKFISASLSTCFAGQQD